MIHNATLLRKVIRHRPSGKFVAMEVADAVYSRLVCHISEAETFTPPEGQTPDAPLKGTIWAMEDYPEPAHLEWIPVKIDFTWEA